VTDDDIPSLSEAQAERDRILPLIEEKAGEEFRDEAEGFVLRYLAAHGATAGETLTAACKQAGIVPHDDRAFGPVYMRLARRGWIVKVGIVKRRRGHGTAGGQIWTLT